MMCVMGRIAEVTGTVKARVISCERMYDSLKGLNLELGMPGESRYLIRFEHIRDSAIRHDEFVSHLPYSAGETVEVEFDHDETGSAILRADNQSTTSVALKWIIRALVAGAAIYLAVHFGFLSSPPL